MSDKPTNWSPNPNQQRAMAEELVRHAALTVEDANKMLAGTGAAPLAAPGTREAALLQRDRLKNDSEFVKRYLAGDTEAIAQMTKLNTEIVGQQ